MTERIQEELRRADILPKEHFVDVGYMSARVLDNSQTRFGIEVVSLVSVDTQWQAHAPDGIDANQFIEPLSTRKKVYQLELGQLQEPS